MATILATSPIAGAPWATRVRRVRRFLAMGGWLMTIGLLSTASTNAFACRYNVRDVGFMDLESEQYRLQVLTRPSTSPSEIMRLQTLAEGALRGSNVRLEGLDQEPNARNASPDPIPAFPTLVLISPEGQKLTLPTTNSDATSGPDWEALLGQLVTSPTRGRLLECVSQSFAALLLLDGTDPDANERARATLEDSIEQTRAQMRTLPKAIAKPPEIIRLDTASFEREATLLWSLSLNTQPTSYPRALVLYGRLRWIGPVMKGEEITTRNTVGLLSMIGADCECGLDLQWTLGTRVPARWPDHIHALAVKGLGFDPENPVVKTEIASILDRRQSDTRSQRRRSPSPEPPTASASEPVPEQARNNLDGSPQTSTPIATALPTPETELPTSLAWLALSALAGFVILASGVLIRRARRQQRPDDRPGL